MVIIDLHTNQLILNFNSSELKSFQALQINHWGFVRTPQENTYVLDADSADSILLKVVDFLKEETIPHTITEECRKRLKFLQSNISEFTHLKETANKYKEGRLDAAKFREFAKYVDARITRKLKTHQLKAAFHLHLVGNGANFSVPGSGKTTVVLTNYEWLKTQGKVNLLFVVGPSACFSPWRTEFKLTLNRTPTYKILAGGDYITRRGEYSVSRQAISELYLVTYQTLLRDEALIKRFLTQAGVKAYLVIDEAHYIKQIDGSWAQSVLSLAKHAVQRCILTGTPMPRSYSDIFNMFDFLWPEYSPIEAETKTKIIVAEENKDYSLIKQTLKQAVSPLFYRVRKKDLGLKPALFHAPIVIEMNKYEKVIYDAIDKKIRSYSQKEYLQSIELVKKLRRGRIIRLRQCISNAGLLSKSIENYTEDLVGADSKLAKVIYNYNTLEKPAKLEYLLKFIKRLQEEKKKVVIWSNFVGTLELIQQTLTSLGYYCKSIYGKVPVEQTAVDEEETREAIRNEFVDSSSGLDILIANPAACAESISLHKACQIAVYYDLSYNCAQYLQSLDRIHRVGGSEDKEAHYYFLQYGNTIDKDIRDNLETKAAKMSELIDEEFAICSLDMFEDDGDEEAFNRMYGSKT